MATSQDIDEVSSGILVWQVYDKNVKADLFSTAVQTEAGTYIIDPSSLDLDSLARLRTLGKIAGICVTNVNHVRSAAQFATTFSVPIFAHNALCRDDHLRHATGMRGGDELAGGLTWIALEGGPAGEMALHHAGNGGTIIVGDALINFEPHGFALLPAKYCLDVRLLRQSLIKLLDYEFERMLFAHGTPILSGARKRVEQLLATN